MHVDGETESGFFAAPRALMAGRDPGPARPAHFFIIAKGSLRNSFAVTPRITGKIVRRALDTGPRAALRTLLLATDELPPVQLHPFRSPPCPQASRTTFWTSGSITASHFFDAGMRSVGDGDAWTIPAVR